MKVRTGFVSNSSSSSFVIYGTTIQEEKLHKFMIEKLGEEKANELIEDGCYYTITDEIFKEEPYELLRCEYDIYFGRCPFGIKDNETGKEFREGTETKAKELFGANECRQISEVIYG